MNALELIKEIHRDNLCTYFVLPLIKLNKESFISKDNFIDSYLTRDGLNILVKVVDTAFFHHRMVMHPQYQATWEAELTKHRYVQYSIPHRWQQDVQTFMKGKYSHMSNDAKEMIIQHSSMMYRERRLTDHVPITDVRILALDRSEAVRDLWESHYGMRMDKEAELLSIAGERAYIDISKLKPCDIAVL
jgi:hypothetical protein